MSTPPPLTRKPHDFAVTSSSAASGTAVPFKRIFTREDEILLLKSFAKLANPDKITKEKVRLVKDSLGKKFSDSQLTGKLRKMRRKYQNMGKVGGIGKGFDREVFEMSKKIWGNSESFKEDGDDDDLDDGEDFIGSDAEIDGEDGLGNAGTDSGDGLNDLEMEGRRESSRRGVEEVDGEDGMGWISDREDVNNGDGLEAGNLNVGSRGFGEGMDGIVGKVVVADEEREVMQMSMDGENGLRDVGAEMEMEGGDGLDGLEIDVQVGLGRKVGVQDNGNDDDGLGARNVEVRSGDDSVEMNGNVGTEVVGGGVNRNVRSENDGGGVNGNVWSDVDGGGVNGNGRSGVGGRRWRIARRKVDEVPAVPTPLSPTGNHNTTTPVTAVTTSPRFQRIFREEDEIRLLKSFSKFAKSTNPTKITTASVKRFKNSLVPKFTNTQLSDKLRRLRLKYQKMAKSKSKIRSVHDQEIYEISKKIWGKNGNSRESEVDDDEGEEVEELSTQENDEVDGKDDGNHAGINNQDGLTGLNASNIDTPSVERDVTISEMIRENGLRDVEIHSMGDLGGLNVSEIDSQGGSRKRVSVPEVNATNKTRRLSNSEMENGRDDGMGGMNNQENVINGDGQRAGNVNARSEVDGEGMNENVRSEVIGVRGRITSQVDVNKYPFLLKEFSRCLPENPVWREGFKEMSEEKLKNWNEDWKKLQIEEARIMAKRAGMLQDQMKELLEFS